MQPKHVAMIVAPLLVAVVAVPVGIAMAAMAFFSASTSAAHAMEGCDTVGQDVVLASGGPARAPIAGTFRYSSPFGQRFHPVLQVWRLHAGADLTTVPSGGKIVAAKAGKVATVVHGDPGAGNFVEIDHGGGIRTRYFHLASISATQGEQISAGGAVGVEGTTGLSTGNHLHFEVHRGGRPVDPIAWLKQQGVKMPPLGGTATAAASSPSDAAVDLEVVTAVVSSGGQDPADAPKGSARSLGRFNAEQVRVAMEIIRAANTRGLDQWSATVGVMTGIGESDLRELDHGDSAGPDSRGVFQQRTSWGPLNKRMDAYSSALLFFDALVKVKGYRDLSPTLAAHRTQGNADANHYARSWKEAVTLVSQITDDPALAAALAKSDGNAAGCDGEQVVRGMPGAPGSCQASGSSAEKGLQPVALRGLRCTSGSFDWVETMYGVGERQGPSDHGSGMAVDFMIPAYSTPAGRERGWQLAQWTRKHAQELGVKYVIWDVKVWSVDRDSEGWRPYTRYAPTSGDTLLHKDHVHVSYQ
jgi:hypothetical protein